MVSQPDRPVYHLSPPGGRLNDPNGLFLSAPDMLHVFYQHDPNFPHAPKRTGWGHARIPLEGPQAFIPQHLPSALVPDQDYDRDGCYSGCAVHDGDRTYFFYTGNRKDDGVRQATQNLVAVESPEGPFTKDPANPLIPAPAPGFTAHYRDPHVTREPGSNAWRMVIGAQREGAQREGAQREDQTGSVVYYRSTNLRDWEFQGELTFDTSHACPGSAPDMIPEGFMWECPNLLRLRDQETGEDLDVLVFCPQSLDEVEEMDPENPDVVLTHYANSDQCGYIVGRLEGTTFHGARGFSELDFGHDFYAPQLLGLEDGTAYLLGWMGLPAQDNRPSLEAGWVHMLTCLRHVELRAGRLYQAPLVPTDALRWEAYLGEGDVEKQLVDTDGIAQVRLHYRADSCTLDIARRGQGDPRDRGDGNAWDVRTVRVPRGRVEMLIDAPAIEIFAGDGAVTAALQAYPSPGASWDF